MLRQVVLQFLVLVLVHALVALWHLLLNVLFIILGINVLVDRAGMASISNLGNLNGLRTVVLYLFAVFLVFNLIHERLLEVKRGPNL